MKLFKTIAVAAAATAMPVIAYASGSNTGVEEGFAGITDTMETLISGAGGYLILIISIIVAAVTLMATGRWTYVITAVAVSLFLGYGLNIVTSIGGVTAQITALDLTTLSALQTGK